MIQKFALFQTHFPKWIISWILVAFDVFTGFAAFKMTFGGTLPLQLFFYIHGVWIIVALAGNLYSGQFTISRIGELQLLFQLTFGITVAYIFLEALEFSKYSIEPQKAIEYWFIFLFGTSITRILLRTYQKYLLRHGVGRERTAIIGYNSRGKSTANILLGHEQQGYDVIGFIRADDDPENGKVAPIPVLGHENELIKIITSHKISTIVVSFANPDQGRLMDVTTMVNGYPVDIKVIPDLSEIVQGFVRTQQIAGLPLVSIHPVYNSFYMKFIKRVLDRIFAFIFLLLSSPIWILIMAAIKIDTKGPIFYRQVRSGYRGREFKIFKFRSMVHDAEARTGPVWAGGEDPRVTSVGKILRRFRLDEIPQLLNVLDGDMSMIGPRPERPYFIDQLVSEFPFYNRRMNVYPGITGWAQIKHPPDEKIEDVREKLKYDFYYIENLTWNLDMKIALSTIWVIISGHGR